MRPQRRTNIFPFRRLFIVLVLLTIGTSVILVWKVPSSESPPNPVSSSILHNRTNHERNLRGTIRSRGVFDLSHPCWKIGGELDATDLYEDDEIVDEYRNDVDEEGEEGREGFLEYFDGKVLDGNELDFPIDLSKSLVIFLHVPKAAGSTIENKVFKYQARKRGLFINKHEEDFLNRTHEDQERINLVLGHRGYGLHLQPNFKVKTLSTSPQSSKQVIYVTVLREPISRVLSQFQYAKRAALENFGPDSKQFASVQNLSLGEWFSTFDQRLNSPWKADNNPNVFQFSHFWSPFNRSFTSKPTFPTSATSSLSNHSQPLQQDSLPPIAKRPMTRRDLFLAKRHLARFAVVGLMENFDDSVRLLSKALGWYEDPEMKPEVLNNRSINRASEEERKKRGTEADWDPKVLELIRRRNSLDIELFQFGVCLFQHQLRARGLAE